MLKWLLTGGLIPPILMLCGLFFVLYLRGYPFRSPRRMLDALRTKNAGGVSSFRALMQALAGTLGVGNIVGVANAIAVGGAGAVLWMWVSALLAMILKYAEILLAVRHRRVGERGFFGGAVYYIGDAVKNRRLGRWIATTFAALMLLNALTMGCLIQTEAVSASVGSTWGIPPWVCGIALLLLVIPPLSKGSRGVSALTEYLVPVMTLGYVVLSVAVLVLRYEELPRVMREILGEASAPRAATGGVLGFLTSRALRVGTMRGLLSNEAGCGTAPTAHAEANAQSPAAQGVWGICEVFVDTIVLCSATAFVILVGDGMKGMGVTATLYAYTSALGNGAAHFLTAAILCFGYATLLCWGAYGLETVRFLSVGRAWRRLYVCLFGVCICFGVLPLPAAVWDVADLAIASMTLINLAVLLKCRREIRAETLLFCQK